MNTTTTTDTTNTPITTNATADSNSIINNLGNNNNSVDKVMVVASTPKTLSRLNRVTFNYSEVTLHMCNCFSKHRQPVHIKLKSINDMPCRKPHALQLKSLIVLKFHACISFSRNTLVHSKIVLTSSCGF